MATIVVPFRPNGKTRLSANGTALARAMLDDVLAACEQVGPTLVADLEVGQAEAVQAALAGVDGPVAIVNADLPCALAEDVERLLAALPPDGLALVEAADGTTNALALSRAELFQPLYGPGSAERFRARAEELGLDAVSLALPNLAQDVDRLADLDGLALRAGPRTQAAVAALHAA
jgi:2-phospho-L-lactate guanylyltransferase (CobY/MobA/RfbA family)